MVVEGACLLVILIGRLGRRGTGLVPPPPPPRKGGMVLATSRKTQEKELFLLSVLLSFPALSLYVAYHKAPMWVTPRRRANGPGWLVSLRFQTSLCGRSSDDATFPRNKARPWVWCYLLKIIARAASGRSKRAMPASPGPR